MKILGFYFDSNSTAVCHVNETINKFYSKLWTLRFLKRSGMASADLLNIYNVVIRSAVEYCSVVYHPLIPAYMSDKLEQIQKQAIKIIFGNSVSYADLISEGRIETLKERRIKNIAKFANKAVLNPKFSEKWFPINTTERDARTSTRKKYIEKNCTTERSRNNPVQYMIRILNQQAMDG